MTNLTASPCDRVPDLGPGRTPYALGFAFDDRGRVALIRKNRPAWQAGLLNGVGGHVEDEESPLSAMRREFVEETGVHVESWTHVANVEFDAGAVWVFAAHVAAAALDATRSCTDETVEVVDVVDVVTGRLATVANLSWLVPLAAYTHDTYVPFVAREVAGFSGPLP